ncbi:nucleotidyltransferase family protein [Methylomonas paludis]|uniref:Nucleotidyltransferase family protein n=1 Tax=Methylomonas paludis TaxID=1173101 RepID=A0A975MPM8_9GAMM|nr:nucleotidyltransferase family protein [Methylomonas paludis]QWF71723.1 nucleotidyltransferase family protein [Methylomonas paludis]
MKAMILAAGRGERMRPLTDTTPKPLLQAGTKTLIEYSLENLAGAGFTDIVINLAHLGEQIRRFCGNGQRWGLHIAYSDEGDTALETAGGIRHALPLLGDAPFLVVNADVICAYPLAQLRTKTIALAHLVLIDNPAHHPQGDFQLNVDGSLTETGGSKLTFSGIGIYHPALFSDIPAGPYKLRPVLEQAMRQAQVSGEYYQGLWLDIGSPQRLAEVSAADLKLPD